MWERLDKTVTAGILVPGDKLAPPTRWWNHWFLVLFGWKTVATFRVGTSIAKNGYSVGYTTDKGVSWQSGETCHDQFFSLKVGHEDCVFFAYVMPENGFFTLQPPGYAVLELVAVSRLH